MESSYAHMIFLIYFSRVRTKKKSIIHCWATSKNICWQLPNPLLPFLLCYLMYEKHLFSSFTPSWVENLNFFLSFFSVINWNWNGKNIYVCEYESKKTYGKCFMERKLKIFFLKMRWEGWSRWLRDSFYDLSCNGINWCTG